MRLRGYPARRRVAGLAICALVGALTFAAGPVGTAGADSPGSTFVSVTPTRLVDSRINLGASGPHIAAGASVALTLAGATSPVPLGATAVAVNLTVTQPKTAGWIAAYQPGSTPNTSSVNFAANQTVANMAVVPLDSDGQIDLRNGASGTVQVIADVTGYFTAGSPQAGGFVSVTPTRLVDSRINLGASGPIAAGASVALTLAGATSPVPLGATAVAVNLTVTQPKTAGWIAAYQPGSTPNTSSVNFAANQTVANMAVVPLDTDGQIDLRNGASGTVQVIADVTGYFAAGPPQAGGFAAVSPTRLVDSRIDLGASGPIAAGASVALTLAGATSPVPLGATAVAVNLTVTQPKTAGWIAAYQPGSTPNTSSVNFAANQTVANMAVVPLDSDGQIDLRNGASGTVEVIADVTGYFTGPWACVTSAVQGLCPFGGTPQITGAASLPWVGQNVWSPIAGYQQTLSANSPQNWQVVANAPAGGTAVIAYPNTGAYFGGSVDSYHQVTSSFSENMNMSSQTSGWAMYDLWYDNWTAEVMIQHDFGISGPCNSVATATFGGSNGVPVQTWHLCDFSNPAAGLTILDWKLGTSEPDTAHETSGSIDILAMSQWLEANGYMAANSTFTAISAGWEICSTGGQDETFQMANYSVTAS